MTTVGIAYDTGYGHGQQAQAEKIKDLQAEIDRLNAELDKPIDLKKHAAEHMVRRVATYRRRTWAAERMISDLYELAKTNEDVKNIVSTWSDAVWDDPHEIEWEEGYNSYVGNTVYTVLYRLEDESYELSTTSTWSTEYMARKFIDNLLSDNENYYIELTKHRTHTYQYLEGLDI